MQASIQGRQASATCCEVGGSGSLKCWIGPMRMPRPPSLTLTLGQVASSAMSRRHCAKVWSALPAYSLEYGPTPSGPPTWLRMMAVSGKARASAVTSGSCGWYCQASKLSPSGANCAKPSRKVASPYSPRGGLVWLLWIIGLASQPPAWRMPLKRPSGPPPAAMWAANTSLTAAPSVRSAKPTIPAQARISPSWPLAHIAATPLANSVSPTGRSATGPSAR